MQNFSIVARGSRGPSSGVGMNRWLRGFQMLVSQQNLCEAVSKTRRSITDNLHDVERKRCKSSFWSLRKTPSPAWTWPCEKTKKMSGRCS